MKPEINLPNSSGQGPDQTIATPNNLVIIGANGSGKSRLGTSIERKMEQRVVVQRITAQRALQMSDYAPLKGLEQSLKLLQFGYEGETASIANKDGSRFGGNRHTGLLSDFDWVLSALFAEKALRDSRHTQMARESGAYVPVWDSNIDIITKVWEDVMPQRRIVFEDNKVTAKKGDTIYRGGQMSDGERVALYLMGQCLMAPENSIVIIDEPEIHLHRALMTRLWNKIEEYCPNKRLIYITHDLEFAASRKEATKIWVKSYDGNDSWIWEIVPEIDAMPENLVLEIMGNRKNIIFVEGDKTSLDHILYQAVYPDFHVIPRGGCEKVIETTKATRENPALNHIHAVGIVDSDYRSEEEVIKLKISGIYTIDVAEIENLVCTRWAGYASRPRSRSRPVLVAELAF